MQSASLVNLQMEFGQDKKRVMATDEVKKVVYHNKTLSVSSVGSMEVNLYKHKAHRTHREGRLNLS